MTLLEAARQALPGIAWEEQTAHNGATWLLGDFGEGRYSVFGVGDIANAVANITSIRDKFDSLLGETPRAVLAADLAALRERMRWVPVSERLPMDLLNRNVMDAQGNVGTARQRLPYAAGIWDKTGSETLGMITHWKDMPDGFDTGLCASCCGTGLTDLHCCDGVIFQPRLCPCGCPRPLPAAPEVPQ